MHYFANPSTPAVRAAMSAGHLGCMTTPAQGNRIPDRAKYAADNGKFGNGWPGDAAWFEWLTGTVERYGRERCVFATAPDEVCDPYATREHFERWRFPLLDLGVPIAFVAQDGCELERDLIPWGQFEWLFIGGSTEWKLGPAAAELARQARWHGEGVHMGRVNSRRRIRYAEAIGCDSADGTYIARGPDVNLPRALGWADELAASPAMFDEYERRASLFRVA